MKRSVRFLSVLIAVVLCLSVFAACPFSLTASAAIFGNITTTTGNYQYDYTGNPIKPYITVKNNSGEVLTNKVDYKLVYSNNVELGYARVTVIGLGDYNDRRVLNFKIVPPAPKKLKIVESHVTDSCTLSWTDNPVVEKYEVYNRSTKLGETTEGTFTVNGLEGKERFFRVYSWVNGTKSAKSEVVLMGMANTIVNTKSKTYAYTGEKIRPILTVSRYYDSTEHIYENHKDYTLKYSNNVNIGTATVTVTGIGKYFYGSRTYNFDIVPKAVSNLKITGHTNTEASLTWDASDDAQKYYIYNNSDKIGETTDTSFTVTDLDGYTKNFKVRAVAQGKNAKGATEEYVSEPKNVTLHGMKSAYAGVKYTAYSYTGKAICPVVSVRCDGSMLTNHKDYSIKYINNVMCGQASVRIRALGDNYYGEVTKDLFKIRPAKITGTITVSDLTATSAALSWNAAPNVDKYIVEVGNGETIRTTKTSCTLSGLNPGQNYSVSITPVVVETTGSGEEIEHTGYIRSVRFTTKSAD